MSIVKSIITLSNPVDSNIEPVELNVEFNTQETHFLLPVNIVNELGLKASGSKDFVENFATVQKPYVGPIKLQYKDTCCFIGAIVTGEKPVLGSMCLNALGLKFDLNSYTLEKEPASIKTTRAPFRIETKESIGLKPDDLLVYEFFVIGGCGIFIDEPDEIGIINAPKARKEALMIVEVVDARKLYTPKRLGYISHRLARPVWNQSVEKIIYEMGLSRQPKQK